MGTPVPPEFCHFELRKLGLQGAISGLFFAQTVSWQEFVDSIIVRLVGTSTNDPQVALWRAMLITLFTSGTAWLLLVIARRCDKCTCRRGCAPPVVVVSAANAENRHTP